MIATLKLPEFDLPEWTPRDFVAVRKAEERIATITQRAGVGSQRFLRTCENLLAISGRVAPERLVDAIVEPIDVRAFTYLLATSEGFAARVGLSEAMLQRLVSVRSPMSRLSLMQLIRVYFVHYDGVADAKTLVAWGRTLQRELAHRGQRGGASELKSYHQYGDLLFAANGPSRLVEQAHLARLDFDTMLDRYGLSGFGEARYINQCRYRYYLAELDRIPVGDDHPLLAELCKPAVYNVSYTSNQLLGHAFIERLIDRTGQAPISPSWQKTILAIAGDPRVPRSSPRYQKWWSLLGEKRVAKMRGWLSRFDLKLFLEVLEQSAKEGGITDMERMYAPRKVFMEGLLAQGLVTESRLFLGRYAQSYLQKHYKKEDLPDYARVRSAQTSMIYLNIAGRVHLVEGSHSFKLKLMDKLPHKSRITDYERTQFADTALRTEVGLHMELVHGTNLGWQIRAVEFIRSKGLVVDTLPLIPSNRRREFKRIHGAHR